VRKSEPQNLKSPSDRSIGVFDSGLGGLTVVRELSAAMENEEIVYLGDSARVPYGIKSAETIRRFALEDAAFLKHFSPKLIVVACNTASAAAIEQLRATCAVDVVDVIRPGAASALAQTDEATARSSPGHARCSCRLSRKAEVRTTRLSCPC